jgi:hypothetical protein
MACLRLKPTSDAPLPAKIIRLRRSDRRAKAHISTKPDIFRRQFPELAEGRCAFQVLGRPCPAGVSAAARRGALVPPPAGFIAMPVHVPPALRGGFAPPPCPGGFEIRKNCIASKRAKFR